MKKIINYVIKNNVFLFLFAVLGCNLQIASMNNIGRGYQESLGLRHRVSNNIIWDNNNSVIPLPFISDENQRLSSQQINLDENQQEDLVSIWIKEDLFREIEETNNPADQNRLNNDYIVRLTDNREFKVCKFTYQSLLDYKENQEGEYSQQVEVSGQKLNEIKSSQSWMPSLPRIFSFMDKKINKPGEKVYESAKKGSVIGKEILDASLEIPNIAVDGAVSALSSAGQVVRSVSNVRQIRDDAVDYTIVRPYNRITGDLDRMILQRVDELRNSIQTEVNNAVNRVDEQVANVQVNVRSEANNVVERVDRQIKDIHSNWYLLNSNSLIKVMAAATGLTCASMIIFKYLFMNKQLEKSA